MSGKNIWGNYNPDFFMELSQFINCLEKYKDDYAKSYSDLENSSTYMDDIRIADKVREAMSARLPGIREQFDRLRQQLPITEMLETAAQKTYLPKKMNVPNVDDESHLPEQRIYLHVKKRIETLNACMGEFFSSVDECFDEAAILLIYQKTFDGALEAAAEFNLALNVFSQDFPRIFGGEPKLEAGTQAIPGRGIEER